jgi:uncharacterized protein YecE (DUF72 family)
LAKLPKQHRYVVEVRNKSWQTPEYTALLQEKEVAVAGTEKLGNEVGEATAGFVYLRWEGDRKAVNGLQGKIEVDRKADLKAWADKLKQVLGGGVEVFGYFGKYFSGLPPSDVRTLLGFIG